MKITLLLLFTAVLLSAAEKKDEPKPTPPPPPAQVGEVNRLKWQNLMLRLELINRERTEVITNICQDAKVLLEKCQFDPSNMTVSEMRPPAPSADAKTGK